MNTLRIKIVQIVTLLIFAAYTLASSLPTLAISLRQFSSPIFVFFIVNTSIFLLSFPRFFPTDHHIIVVAPPVVGTEIEDEVESAVNVAAEDAGIEKESEAEMRNNRSVMAMLEKEEDEEEEEAEISTTVSAEAADETEEEVISDAEFNRMIEAFLAKQKRFHCQENISILV